MGQWQESLGSTSESAQERWGDGRTGHRHGYKRGKGKERVFLGNNGGGGVGQESKRRRKWGGGGKTWNERKRERGRKWEEVKKWWAKDSWGRCGCKGDNREEEAAQRWEKKTRIWISISYRNEEKKWIYKVDWEVPSHVMWNGSGLNMAHFMLL